MCKNFIITNGDFHINQLLSTYLLEKGHKVAMIFSKDEVSNEYMKCLETNRECYPIVCDNFTAESVNDIFEKVKEKFGTIDILIHGNEQLDETKVFDKEPLSFGEIITEHLKKIFLFNQNAVSHMMLKKNGQILFPMFMDLLAYVDYPSSPVLNHAKISMMKCLAKEISAFKLRINALTFGYYDNDFNKAEKKEKQKTLEIFGLKPKIQKVNDLIKGIDILLLNDVDINGQNIHIGVSGEASI